MPTFGVFVDLNPQLRGLVHASNINFSPEIGDKIFVEVKNIAPNGNIELLPKVLKEFQVVEVEKQLLRRKTTELSKYIGKLTHLSGEVIQIKTDRGSDDIHDIRRGRNGSVRSVRESG